MGVLIGDVMGRGLEAATVMGQEPDVCSSVAGALVTCPAEAEDGGMTIAELDVAGFNWTSWDMIQKVRRADQAHSGLTDAIRTECGIDAAGNGESAGQWAFRWAGMGSLMR